MNAQPAALPWTLSVYDHEHPQTPFALRAALRALKFPKDRIRYHVAGRRHGRFVLILVSSKGGEQIFFARELRDVTDFVRELFGQYIGAGRAVPSLDTRHAPHVHPAIAEALKSMPSIPTLPPAA